MPNTCATQGCQRHSRWSGAYSARSVKPSADPALARTSYRPFCWPRGSCRAKVNLVHTNAEARSPAGAAQSAYRYPSRNAWLSVPMRQNSRFWDVRNQPDSYCPRRTERRRISRVARVSKLSSSVINAGTGSNRRAGPTSPIWDRLRVSRCLQASSVGGLSPLYASGPRGARRPVHLPPSCVAVLLAPSTAIGTNSLSQYDFGLVSLLQVVRSGVGVILTSPSGPPRGGGEVRITETERSERISAGRRGDRAGIAAHSARIIRSAIVRRMCRDCCWCCSV